MSLSDSAILLSLVLICTSDLQTQCPGFSMSGGEKEGKEKGALLIAV